MWLLVLCGTMLNVDWFPMCGHTKTVAMDKMFIDNFYFCFNALKIRCQNKTEGAELKGRKLRGLNDLPAI